MPAVAKVSDEGIVRAARRLVERDGVAALSMQAVADSVGVRAPSLYKRFADRAALLGAVQRQLFAELGERLEVAAARPGPQLALRAMADAYRAFARAHPRLYELMFAPDVPRDDAGDAARRAAAQPILSRLQDRTGTARALPTARVLTA
ncbi:MAG TPA: TetR/AcrR family transcriptional regulator, partial [Polyangia bacterium]